MIASMPTLLVITPHPDDEAYAFGGTIALAAKAGWHCIIHCATAGERGKRHDGGPGGAQRVGTVRRRELAASCRVLGAEPPVVWGLPDGALKDEPGQAYRISSLFSALNPDLVLSLGSDGAYGHPDHIAVYEWVRAAWDAVRPVGPPLLLANFPRGLFLEQYEKCLEMMGNPPQPPPEAIGAQSPHYGVDIRSVAKQKRAAIDAHRSQLPSGFTDSIFPGGIVSRLMATERFSDVSGRPRTATGLVLLSLQPPNRDLADLVNLGVKSARWLKEAGIRTPTQLGEMGAGEAYLRVKSQRPESATPNLFYALHGAILGVRWDHLGRDERQALRESRPR
jgi:LmbE family N-acetylglucosaminyl deacetylase